MTINQPRTREALLKTPLQDLSGLCLRLLCPQPCTRIVFMPVALMLKRTPRRSRMQLAQVLNTWHCKACGHRPAKVRVLDQASEGAATWQVDVLP